LVIRTEKGLPLRGIRGVYNGAARITWRIAARSANCASRSK